MLSVRVEAHVGGHKISETECAVAWAMASGGAEAISVDQAQAYVVNVPR
jgi:hypothetical protein